MGPEKVTEVVTPRVLRRSVDHERCGSLPACGGQSFESAGAGRVDVSHLRRFGFPGRGRLRELSLVAIGIIDPGKAAV